MEKKTAEDFLIDEFTKIGSSPEYVRDMVLNDPEFKAVIASHKAYAKQWLEEAAERAKVEIQYDNGSQSPPSNTVYWDDSSYISHAQVNKDSILSIINELN